MNFNLAEMNALDLFLSGLSKEDYEYVQSKIGPTAERLMLLTSGDFFESAFRQRMEAVKKQADLAQFNRFAAEFNWENDLTEAFAENDYEALVITDKNQRIIWVNDGFTDMTGYSKTFAMRKTPRFLQGTETSEATRKRIREKIAKNTPFQDVIINHRKDSTPYKCEVKIIPLYSKETTHYIAFEREVV